jgi:hypothetical protein
MFDSSRHLALICLVGLSCCSPYVYKDGITKFGSAVTTVVSSDSTGKAQLESDAQADQAMIFALARTPVTFSPPTCITGTDSNSAPCSITAYNSQSAAAAAKAASELSKTEQFLTTAETQVAAADPVFDRLQKYSNALVAVTNAADQTTFDTASAGLATAAGNLVGDFNKSAGGAAGPAAQILADIGGFYLESRRYAALKSAVTAVDQLMPTLALVATPSLSEIKTARIANLEAQIKMSTNNLSPSKSSRLSLEQYNQEYGTLQTDLNSLNQLTATDPKATVNAMVSTHHALAAALQSGQGQFGAFATELESFAADAEKLQKAFAGSSSAKGSTSTAKSS